MEYSKLLHLLNEPNNSKLITRKWTIANDISNSSCDVGTEIIYNTEVLKFSLCH